MLGNAPGVWKAVTVVIAASVLGLAGCTGTPEKPVNPKPVVKAGPTASQLLGQARRAIKASEFGNARALLQQLDVRRLNRFEQFEHRLLSIRLALSDTATLDEETLATLSQSLDVLKRQQFSATPQQRQELTELDILLLEQQQQWWPAVQARVALSHQLQGDAQNENHNRIWHDARQIPPTNIQTLLAKPLSPALKGWLTLADLHANQPISLQQQRQRFQTWRLRNAMHPAARQLPAELAALASNAQGPDKIAVLLPLSGPLARSGQAIRDGLMASYFQAKEKRLFTPELQFMDSQRFETLDAAYATALLAGAQWMIGPVSKTDVQSLAKRNALSLPTLALNYHGLDTQHAELTAPEGLFQFGLAPEDEAREIAEKAWNDGLRHPLVMVPKGGWGERILMAFREHWQSLGGRINEVRFYGKENLNADVGAVLNIDSSKQRYKRIRQFMSEDVKFESRRRQDADWVFVAAAPQAGRQIKPSLSFNFARDLPVYSPSRVYTGQPNSRTDKDLDGVRFCDLPWVLNQPELYQDVENSLSNGQGPYVRLYALGADAFWLPERMAQQQLGGQITLAGSTGTLQMDDTQRLHRRGECAIFKDGEPSRMPQVTQNL